MGGDFKTFKIDARRFFLEHVIKVGIFFFPPRAYIFFWPKSLGIFFVINNFLRKFRFGFTPPPPPLPAPHDFSNGLSLNQLLF